MAGHGLRGGHPGDLWWFAGRQVETANQCSVLINQSDALGAAPLMIPGDVTSGLDVFGQTGPLAACGVAVNEGQRLGGVVGEGHRADIAWRWVESAVTDGADQGGAACEQCECADAGEDDQTSRPAFALPV